MNGIERTIASQCSNGGPAPAVASPLGWLLAAPHRIAFTLGAAMLVASSAWWAAEAAATWAGHVPRSAMPPVELHGLLMVFGFMPLFFTGFLFTAVPKWLAVPAPTGFDLGGGLGAQAAGWVVFFVGAASPDRAFAAAIGGVGMVAVALGATSLWWRFVSMVRRSRATDRGHAMALATTGGVGVAALWIVAVGVASSAPLVVGAATRFGLWTFVGGTFATAAHRMIPFLGATALHRLEARWPLALLWALTGLFWAEGSFAACDAAGTRADLPIARWRAIIEIAAGLGLCAQAFQWSLRLPLRIRLVAMLHAGFAWLAASFLLSGLAHWPASLPAADRNAAPLHAFTMGFLGSLLLAMLTRIICAQTGRIVVADDLLWRLFWALQAAVMLRLAASMAARFAIGLQGPLIASAATLWGLVWLTWAWRYVPWLATPRRGRRRD